MTGSCVSHARVSHMSLTGLVYECETLVWHDSFMSATWLLADIVGQCVDCKGSVTWLLHDPFMSVTCECDTWVWHDSFMSATWLLADVVGQHVDFKHSVRCHYEGGGGNISKVKRLAPKSIGTQKLLITGFCLSAVGSLKRCNFVASQVRLQPNNHVCMLQPNNHVCIFSPAHRSLESARKLVVRAILSVWQQFWC